MRDWLSTADLAYHRMLLAKGLGELLGGVVEPRCRSR